MVTWTSTTLLHSHFILISNFQLFAAKTVASRCFTYESPFRILSEFLEVQLLKRLVSTCPKMRTLTRLALVKVAMSIVIYSVLRYE